MYYTTNNSHSDHIDYEEASTKLQRSLIENHKVSDECANLIEQIKSSTNLQDIPFLPKCKTPCLRTPILLAVASRNVANVEKLASVGYSITEPDRHGISPLSYAASNGDIDIVKALVKRNANPTITDRYGCTPLHKAASWNRFETLLLLFEHFPKLDPNLKTKPVACSSFSIAESKLETPLHLAVRSTASLLDNTIDSSQRQASIEVLLKHGADPNSIDMNGDSPFIVAAKNGDWGAMCRLRRAGADPKMVNMNKESGLDAILHSEHIDFKGKLAANVVVNGAPWMVALLEPFCWSRKL